MLIPQSDFGNVFSSAAIVSTNKTILGLPVRSNMYTVFLDGSQHSSPGQLCKVSVRSTPSPIKSESS